MRKEVIATGKTVDAAIDNGCAELSVERGEIDFEILTMPKKGFLGLSQIPAKVRVFIDLPDPPAPAAEKAASAKPVSRPQQEKEKPAPQPAPEKPAVKPQEKPAVKPQEKPAAKPQEKPVTPVREEVPAEPGTPAQPEAAPCDFGNKVALTEEYLRSILQAMGLSEVTVSSTTHENIIQVRLSGDVAGVAIGRHGETLDALQYLTGLAANRGEGDYVRVVLDSGNYRDKRRATLEQLARRLANNALRTGRSTTLEPMNPYERRIIHSAISQIEGVTSASTGEEPNRCVVISPVNPVAAPARDSRGSRDRRPRRDGGQSRSGRSGQRDGRRDSRRDTRRREKPAPYQEQGRREVAPTEAENQPLYGKIEI